MDEQFLIAAAPLLAGYVLDLLLGDPRWLPHPVRLFGNVIAKGEHLLNKGSFRLLKGALLTVILCCIVFFLFLSLQNFLLNLDLVLYFIFTSIFIFYGLANKSLLQEGKEVFDELQQKGLEAGRRRLSRIVGRDTSTLTARQIRIAVLESMSENLSDGVIAPLFFYAILGLPGMMLYKMINTLDSMIGYKNDRFLQFGFFAAKLDDAANWIPSRLTAFLMILVSPGTRAAKFVFKYGPEHASPNSGYPEAALAGILNCRFGGPNIYHGKLVEKPYIGEQSRSIRHEEFKKVEWINHGVTFIAVIIICLFCLYPVFK